MSVVPQAQVLASPEGGRIEYLEFGKGPPFVVVLGATEGILTEPAGGTTVAGTMKLANQGKIGPDDTVVAVISGNGLKTLADHPDKPWPEMVSCDIESMERVLADFRQVGLGTPLS